MKRLLIVMLLVPALLPAATGNPNSLHKQFVVADSLILHGWFTPAPTKVSAPLYVLLPMRGHAHDSYDSFISALSERYRADSSGSAAGRPHILTLDLRGHGLSISAASGELDFGSMGKSEYAKIPDDIVTAVNQLLADSSRQIDRDNIVIIGASIGANSSVMAAAELAGVTKVVMLSPGEDYLSLQPAEAIKSFKGKILICSSKDDTYSSESSESLARLNPKQTLLYVYPGKEHGTNLIGNNPMALSELLDWLER
ncbi:MAG: alpha/beta hydrolase family protein [Candidatus Zixiibacteriota bacterium]